MKNKQLYLLVVIISCFVTKSFSQRYKIQNGFGISGGITQFNIETNNFTTKSSNGFMGGLSATVDIPVRWYNISFGMQLSESPIEILGRPTAISNEEVYLKYKMFAAQAAMLLHIKAIPQHVTIDVGPMLQYNSKLEFKDKGQEGFYVNRYDNLTAKDITDISQFNFNGVVGASVGIKNFKLKAQYIYGFTNILKRLENKELDTTGGSARFKGNQTMLVFGGMVSF
ncbi:hypothetical protein VOI54_04510 [Tamlana sp. 2201CG12-4]|uniref:hypothetical protein n=1 Tax=Tamlana sp. 2201CG12-4 TaxID=3112582 RepID=UPI002DBABF52|nr:hypothetical protein [Tamlana sp. 2201CG12-4]MEC3906266.1 hypothetical protein [Tamlana sp. 2201CG12-4]